MTTPARTRTRAQARHARHVLDAHLTAPWWRRVLHHLGLPAIRPDTSAS